MKFNLINDPWIPVFTDAPLMMSLRDVFSNLKSIREIDTSPLGKIAVLRLLIAIVQSALGNFSEEGWASCKNDIQKKSLCYLDKHTEEFNLYGMFLQIPDLTKKNNSHLSKLFFNRSSGNNHTFFDNMAREAVRNETFSDCEIALALLTYQVMCPGGLLRDRTFGKEETTGFKSVIQNQLVTFIKEENLLDTIHTNLINIDWLQGCGFTLGKPVWELNLTMKDVKNSHGIEKTYLYNLVPLSRSILLEEGMQNFTLAGGVMPVEFPVYRDPMLTVVMRTEKKKPVQKVLRVDPDKAPWRELQSILQIHYKNNIIAAPWALRRINPQSDREISIWTGGLSSSKAKLLDVHEWVYNIHTSLLDSSSLAVYDNAICTANKVEWKIGVAIKIYLKAESRERDSFTYKSLASDALRAYWTRLESENIDLINTINSGNLKEAEENWNRAVRRFSLDAFSQACGKEFLRNAKEFIRAINFLKRGTQNG